MSKEVRFRKKDLISLVWPTNTCCSSLIAGVPKEVIVDKVEGTWAFRGQVQKIGSRRYPCMAITGDPIGVYDKTKIEHLRAMKDDAEYIQNSHRSSSIYDD